MMGKMGGQSTVSGTGRKYDVFNAKGFKNFGDQLYVQFFGKSFQTSIACSVANVGRICELGQLEFVDLRLKIRKPKR